MFSCYSSWRCRRILNFQSSIVSLLATTALSSWVVPRSWKNFHFLFFHFVSSYIFSLLHLLLLLFLFESLCIFQIHSAKSLFGNVFFIIIITTVERRFLHFRFLLVCFSLFQFLFLVSPFFHRTETEDRIDSVSWNARCFWI